jgi:SOS response regulatory protein OraA/RecX
MYAEARNRLLNRISRRETSKKDAQKYLQKHKFAPEIIEALVNEFVEKTWIDDSRYTRALIRELSLRGKGPRFMIQKLKEKGITVEARFIEQELSDQNMGDENEQAIKLLERKFQRLSLPTVKQELFKLNQKALGFLIRRGFSVEASKQAWSEWITLRNAQNTVSELEEIS